jgi:glycosyltransferase involved in cell wall biosynthesis
MNIGIVVPYFTPYVRGNEYGLAQSISELGHNVTIIASTARAPRESMLPNAKEDNLKHNFNVKYLRTLMDVGDNPIITGIEKHIRNQDLVMLQEDYPLICHKAYAVARKYNIITILSSERTYYPENIVKRFVLKLLDATSNKKLRNGVDMLTAHCTAAREFMMKELNVKREVKVINVGVDTQIFKPSVSENKYLCDSKVKLLTVARLHKYKGLGYLIRAMKIVVKEEPGAKLFILGKGTEEENLVQLVNETGMSSNVIFIKDTVPNNEMPELYAECDVYVQPSIIEPYGIAVLEAMACGKPVVAASVGGMRDTVQADKTGFLVPPADSEQLAVCLLKLCRNAGLRKEIGQTARQRAIEYFDIRYIVSKYLNEITSLKKIEPSVKTYS